MLDVFYTMIKQLSRSVRESHTSPICEEICQVDDQTANLVRRRNVIDRRCRIVCVCLPGDLAHQHGRSGLYCTTSTWLIQMRSSCCHVKKLSLSAHHEPRLQFALYDVMLLLHLQMQHLFLLTHHESSVKLAHHNVMPLLHLQMKSLSLVECRESTDDGLSMM